VSKVARDITERKRVDEELKWKNALFEAQTSSILDGILVVDEAWPEAPAKPAAERPAGNTRRKSPPIRDDARQLAMGRGPWSRTPAQFAEKVAHLASQPDGSLPRRARAEGRDGAGPVFGARVYGKDRKILRAHLDLSATSPRANRAEIMPARESEEKFRQIGRASSRTCFWIDLAGHAADATMSARPMKRNLGSDRRRAVIYRI
jgi:PAS domain-containing protein